MAPLIDTSIQFIIKNFPAILYVLALLLGIITVSTRRRRRQKRRNTNTFIAYMMLLAVGAAGLWGFVFHAFFPQLAATYIGWASSPFQFEVAMANLAMGMAGLFATKASHAFRVATTLFVSIFLGGAAVGHTIQMILHHNFSPGNVGPIYVTDIILPITLIILINLHKKFQDRVFS